MVKPGDQEEGEIWGTWEELLLACAVNRHGTRRWDSVSMEIQSRTLASHLVTPQGCRQRFLDLQRRFGGGGDDDPDPPAEVPWLEDLRKLRVAELRREVERYDLSIGSLQLKVKRLQEERERSLREGKSGEGKPDQDAKEEGGSPGSTPESLAGDRISSGGVSGPSCEQSNSTDPKQEPGQDGREPGEEQAAAVAGAEAADPSASGDEKAAEGSYNGSTGSPAAVRPLAMGESGESIAESKRGGEGGEGEASSDVQSSASLSRRRRGRRRKAVPGGGGEDGEEPEAEDVLIVNKGAVEESQPLVSLLEIIRSDKYGSVFERRLESQESVGYRSLVRQHVDLEIVRAKLDGMGSGRSYATVEFFRDLMLLCTNAVVFYPKGSPESVAAVHLRRLVDKEMAAVFQRPREPTLPPPSPPPPQPEPTAPKPKPEPDLAGDLLDKPIPSAPLIVCRKRSSISNKPAVAAVKEERGEKPDPARKESDNEEKSPPKKTTNERPVLSGTTRGLRTNKVRGGNGGGGPAAKRPNLTPTASLKSKPVEKVTAVEMAAKPDKKNNSGGGAATAAASSAKKQSATSFLNRMKRSSNGTLMEILKSSSSSGGGGGGRGTEPKKEAKGHGRKDQNSRQGTGGGGGAGKKAAETSGGSAKRSVGRPPKRAAAPPTPPPAKKARAEAEAAAPSKTPASASRKRGRR